MEFFAFLAVSVVVVWVFFAWNDLVVVSGRLKAAAAEMEQLDTQRLEAASEEELAKIDSRLDDLRRTEAVSRAHYDRVYASFVGSRLAALLGLAADPVAPATRPEVKDGAPRTA